jgi:tetratricopeptide (TPR) repeat protein
MGTVRALQAGEAQAQHLPADEKEFRRKAINDFRSALVAAPDMVDAGEHLALELAAEEKWDEAIAVWKRVIDQLPTYAEAQGDLADALRFKQDLAGAIEHYRAALASGSKNSAWETQLAYLVATSPLATAADVQPLVAVAKDACDQTQNRSAPALDAYAACLARVGQMDYAITTARQGVAQANAAHQPDWAAGIQKHLAFYQRGLPYIAGTGEATSKPATAPK